MDLAWIAFICSILFITSKATAGFDFTERTTSLFKLDINIWPTKFVRMSLVTKQRASLVRNMNSGGYLIMMANAFGPSKLHRRNLLDFRN